MNQHGMGAAGMGISPMMQQSSPQQPQTQAGPGMNPVPGGVHPQMQNQPHPMPPVQQADKLDNISKVKTLAGPLRESLATTLKTAAQLLQYNNLIDNGTIKGIDNSNQQPPRFDKHLEEFYSICDQIELHLKTSIQCTEQNSAAQRYLKAQVLTTRVEPLPLSENSAVSYPQYLSTVRTQIGYAKDIHDTLICAAQKMSE